MQHIVTKYFADFSRLYQNEFKHAQLNGSKFEKDKDHLDEFYVKKLSVLPYKELSFFIKIILTMSYEEAAMERGFNIDNYTLKTNQNTTRRCYSNKTGQRPLISKQRKTVHYPNHHSFDQSI